MIEVSHKTDPLPFFVAVVPAIIERLGDSKQQVCFSLQEGFVLLFSPICSKATVIKFVKIGTVGTITKPSET